MRVKNHNWKSSYNSVFESKLDKIKEEGHYRYFNEIERKAGNFPKAVHHKDGISKEIDVWCSNDYLGMSQNPNVMQSMKMAVDQLGAGSGGTRNISGTTKFHVALENKIAELHNKECSLAFNSGYSANESALTSILSVLENCLVMNLIMHRLFKALEQADKKKLYLNIMMLITCE